jgi:hypothetical protein
MKTDKIWFNYILLNGAILGISLAIVEFAALYLGLLFRPAMFNIFVFLITISVYIAIRKYRENFLKGLIKFGDAFLIGLLVCGIAGVIWAIYRFFQFKYTPGLIENIINNYSSNIDQNSMANADKETLIKIYKLFMTPLTIAVVNTFFLSMLVGGSLISLLMSYILQRKELPKPNEY